MIIIKITDDGEFGSLGVEMTDGEKFNSDSDMRKYLCSQLLNSLETITQEMTDEEKDECKVNALLAEHLM